MINGNNIGAIIQARMGSTRLPGKTLMDIYGKTTIQRVVERIKQCKLIDNVVVAMTDQSYDDVLADYCYKKGYIIFRGNENDVMSRVYRCARWFKINVIVEITADCPLIDPDIVNKMVYNFFLSDDGYDFYSNVEPRTFPKGMDTRIFTFSALARAMNFVDNDIDRQHCSTIMFMNPRFKDRFIRGNYLNPSGNYSGIEVTLDTKQDLDLIDYIYRCNANPTCDDIIDIINNYPELHDYILQTVERKDYYEELEKCYKEAECIKH